jgi:homoisocitrate dehydrogenase
VKVCLLPGDGIGPDVIAQAVRVLGAVDVPCDFTYADIGLGAFREHGTPLPQETVAKIEATDATLFGAVTTPPDIPNYRSPILRLRQHFDLFANVRPCRGKSADLTIVRENTEGLYSGIEHVQDEGRRVVAHRVITEKASHRIVGFAFEHARTYGYRVVTVVHKANVLRESDGLFRRVALEVAHRYPNIELREMLVDNCAMQLARDPAQFQVIVTTNMFGDILSDVASLVAGGLGMAHAGNMGESKAIFEPVHGSAPDIAGTYRANPFATIRAAAMMLRYCGQLEASHRVEDAVTRAVDAGRVTEDLGGDLSTEEAADAVIDLL